MTPKLAILLLLLYGIESSPFLQGPLSQAHPKEKMQVEYRSSFFYPGRAGAERLSRVLGPPRTESSKRHLKLEVRGGPRLAMIWQWDPLARFPCFPSFDPTSQEKSRSIIDCIFMIDYWHHGEAPSDGVVLEGGFSIR